MNTKLVHAGRLALIACCLVLTDTNAAQSPQSAGGSGGGFGEIKGLPPQDIAIAQDQGTPFQPGPTQIDPFYKVTAPAAGQLDAALEIPVTRNFNGINDTGWFPPDPIIAAGPDYLVAAVNSHIAFFTKQGVKFSQTSALSFFGSMTANYRLFDPWVVYDEFSHRFMLLFTSQRKNTSGTIIGSRYFLGISKSSNPATGWWLYWNDASVNGSTPSGNWSDYPKLATDRNAIYITGNMFGFTSGFKYNKIRIMQNKSTLLSGGTSQLWWDFWNITVSGSTTTKAFTIQPCHDYDTKSLSTAAYFVSCINGTGSNLYFYAINNVTRRTTPTPRMFKTRVSVAGYKSPGNSKQRGGSELVENVAPRLMNAVKRNGSIWCAHSVALGGTTPGAGAQWYEFRVNAWPTSGSMSRRQQQLFWGGTNYYYTFPQVAVNHNNDMAMVFGRSHPTSEYVGCRITGRLSTRALSTLDGSVLLKAGEAYYVRKSKGRNRWGDYLGCCTDPQGNFWYLGEYAKAGNKWGTHIGMTRRAPLLAYVPDANATTGSCNVIPFGHKNVATYRNQKYQQLITASELGNQGVVNITDLGFVSCVSGRRHFDQIVVRLAQTNQTSLGDVFLNNRDANRVTVLIKNNYDWLQTVNQWSQIGFDRSYRYDRLRGRNLVIEIEVRGANMVTSSTAFPGHRTGNRQRLFAYNWKTSPPSTGTLNTSGALKVQVLMEANDLHDYGVGCRGSNRLTPACTVSGSGRLGSSCTVRLSNALPNANTFLSIGLTQRLTTPLDLKLFGAPSCLWYFNNDLTLMARCNSTGRYTLSLPIPLTASAGGRVFFQFFPFDSKANSFGLTNSNYSRLLTGY